MEIEQNWGRIKTGNEGAVSSGLKGAGQRWGRGRKGTKSKGRETGSAGARGSHAKAEGGSESRPPARSLKLHKDTLFPAALLCRDNTPQLRSLLCVLHISHYSQHLSSPVLLSWEPESLSAMSPLLCTVTNPSIPTAHTQANTMASGCCWCPWSHLLNHSLPYSKTITFQVSSVARGQKRVYIGPCTPKAYNLAEAMQDTETRELQRTGKVCQSQRKQRSL